MKDGQKNNRRGRVLLSAESPNPMDESGGFIVKSVSWPKTVLREVGVLASDAERATQRPFNFSKFVSDAVIEKMARQKYEDNASPIRDIIRKELSCLLGQPPQRSA